MRILLTKRENDHKDGLTRSRKILSLCRGIFGADPSAQAFLYLCENGAATVWILQIQLGLPEATVYRTLKHLRALGVIEPILKVPRRGRTGGGPVPRVWGLQGIYTDEDVARCINLHYRCLSPKYRLAEEIAQSILDEYLFKRLVSEISFREILAHVRELRTPFVAGDVADLAAQYLSEQGMKVWR